MEERVKQLKKLHKLMDRIKQWSDVDRGVLEYANKLWKRYENN